VQYSLLLYLLPLVCTYRHRGYLYFFERILLKAAGAEVGSLALPWWDWEEDGDRGAALPMAYRERTYTDASGQVKVNPLLHLPRRAGLNDLTNPDRIRGIKRGLDAALAEKIFSDGDGFGFNTSLEGGPHNRIHTFIGRDMSNTVTAGRDPIFWAHHANVDRQWNIWLKNSSNQNLSDTDYLTTEYRFVDADGCEVSVTIGDIIDATKLGYEYEGLSNPVLSPPIRPRSFQALQRKEQPTFEEVASSAPARAPASGRSRAAFAPTNAPKPLDFAPEVVQLYASAGSAASRERGRATKAGLAAAEAGLSGASATRWVIEIEGLEYTEAPVFVFDVLLSRPGSSDAAGVFLGSINFFSSPRGPGSTFNERFNATSAIEELGLGGDGTEQPVVTLLPRTVVPSGAGRAAEERAAAIEQEAKESVGPAEMKYRRINLLKKVSVQ
jgi:hypothetical protein